MAGADAQTADVVRRDTHTTPSMIISSSSRSRSPLTDRSSARSIFVLTTTRSEPPRPRRYRLVDDRVGVRRLLGDAVHRAL
jgi:hypothetical protein